MKKDMFTLLSEKSDNEIIIKIAYTFYKNQKVEYIASLDEETRNDASKLNNQLKEFYKTVYLSSSVDTYLNQAQEFVESFAGYISDTVTEEYESRIDGMEKAFKTNLELLIKKHLGGFMKGVWQGVLASFLFFIISGLIIFFIWLKDIPGDKIASAFINGDKATELTKDEKPKE